MITLKQQQDSNQEVVQSPKQVEFGCAWKIHTWSWEWRQNCNFVLFCSSLFSCDGGSYTCVYWPTLYVFISSIATLCSILIISFFNVCRCIGVARVLNIVRSTFVDSHFSRIFVCCSLDISVRRKFDVIRFVLHMYLRTENERISFRLLVLLMPALCAACFILVLMTERN